MTIGRVFSWLGLVSAFAFIVSIAAFADTTSILNASYDVSRELYKDINPAFVAAWKKSSGADIEVKQSHGGSTKQAQAVAEGLEADIVTLNQPTDLDFLVTKGVVGSDWRKKFPDGAAPYTTTSIFLVRKGNPKGIKDWDDLAKPGVSVVIPNPKTFGNGRAASFSNVTSTSPMARCVKVVVAPRPPPSNTGTLPNSLPTKSRALSAEPNLSSA